jgi:hypothetical protein
LVLVEKIAEVRLVKVGVDWVVVRVHKRKVTRGRTQKICAPQIGKTKNGIRTILAAFCKLRTTQTIRKDNIYKFCAKLSIKSVDSTGLMAQWQGA